MSTESTESSVSTEKPITPAGRSTRRRGRRRREVLAATAATAGAGVLAACQVPGQSASPRLDEREVTLTYLTDWTSGARGEWVKLALPRFTQEHPKIKVQVENATGSLQTVLLASAGAGRSRTSSTTRTTSSRSSPGRATCRTSRRSSSR